MPVNSTHPDYDATLPAWVRARDVVAGEDAVKAAGEKYLPRLDSQSDNDYRAYKARGSFFNAAARTAEGFMGLIFRRDPVIRVPSKKDTLSVALAKCIEDMDLLGTALPAYARNVIEEVVIVGRCGTLVDWESDVEQRAYASLYHAEDIRNWRVERVNGRNVLTLLVLHESVAGISPDGFVSSPAEQLRVLRLEPVKGATSQFVSEWQYVVELWQQQEVRSLWRRSKQEWTMVERRVPLRLGKPLPLIPFVFHGPRHALPDIDKLPLTDIIAVNLDHYRLSADYRHGLHYTALPTAYVTGFTKDADLRIGSSVVWQTETLGATAGFLEFKGEGLMTFERAMDRAERLMAVLGTRMLAEQKRVGESADAIALRQSGENSVLGALAVSVSDSLTHVLRWCYWWHSTEEKPDLVTADLILVSLNTDFSLQGMDAPSITALVSAWQTGGISHDTLLDALRKGEVIPDGRTNAEEKALAAKGFQFSKGGG